MIEWIWINNFYVGFLFGMVFTIIFWNWYGYSWGRGD
jgi:hypothetical protein